MSVCPSRALPVSTLVDLVTLTLKLVRLWDEQPSYQFFCVSSTIHSRRVGQHLSDVSRDLVTLTLEVTALVSDAGLRAPSVYQV